MIVGIVGLGLIGGSMAKAYSASGTHAVYAYDLDSNILEFASMAGACQGALDETTISSCDLILLAISPAAAIRWLEAHAPQISSRTLVMDLGGTKRFVCSVCFTLAQQFGFTFVGGHPMAGTHNAGFKYAKANLFRGAPMLIVPPEGYDMAMLDRIKTMLAPAEFGKLSVITADKHDEIIAFTSQMCHLISNAYIKSPTALEHKGFSAGSYIDLTRVAWLNPDMWAELMLENQNYMLREMDILIENLRAYQERKKEVDG